ncbi:MAG TPA: PrgI family protein [Candidatus Yonathbacteria bacterium]|nr:PrgI family protein [Candidatus Yonathbacteria bacterium]
MQFKVPQYIDIEDKIFGPFTIKQFVYLAGGGGIIFVVWKILPTFLAILVILPVGGLTWALAFFPKQKFGRPFVDVLESAFTYTTQAKLYTWKKESRKIQKDVDLTIPKNKAGIVLPKVIEGKIKDLSQNLITGSDTLK